MKWRTYSFGSIVKVIGNHRHPTFDRCQGRAAIKASIIQEWPAFSEFWRGHEVHH